MSIVLEQPHIDEQEPAKRLLTAADLAAMPDELPSGSVRYELWEGELRVMPLPVYEHGRASASLIGALMALGQWRGHGEATGEIGILLGRDPDTVVGPDAAFLTSEQLPPRRSPEGFLETMPALMAEVRSKNNTWKSIDEKVQRYLALGCRLVWVLDPKRRRVLVHRPGQEPQVLAQEDVLTADGVIPDFEIPVSRLFEGI
jgi:Uma2 family endonuclease